MAKVLNFIFFLYFLTHIPITLLFDSQVLVSDAEAADIYPKIVRELLQIYSASFKDPMVIDPPQWFRSFVWCEMFLQFPFFFFAVYAFWKGNCRWIRIPAIVYSTHVATTVWPIIFHIMRHDFTGSKPPGPSTMEERLKLLAIYAPYFVVPLLLLLTMLFSSEYRSKAAVAGEKPRAQHDDRAYTKSKRN